MVHLVMSRNHVHEKYRNLVFNGRPICIITTIVSKKKTHSFPFSKFLWICGVYTPKF